MTIIGIDTAGRLGGVAVVSGGRLLGSHTLGVQEGHSQNLLPSLEGLMHALDLGAGDVDGIAVAIGPGSYTGLRIGVAVAKGLGYAWGVPVRGVSTLLATAWSMRGVPGAICASLDARKGHVFSATFCGRGLVEAGEAELVSAWLQPEGRRSVDEIGDEVAGFLSRGDDVYLVGDGAPFVHEAVLGRPGVQEAGGGRREAPGGYGARIVVVPLDGEAMRAASVAHIGEIELARGSQDDLFALSPNYLRRSEAERRWRQKP